MSDCVICKEKFGISPQAPEKDSIEVSHLNIADGTLKVAATKCGHIFHYRCINDWLISSGTNCKCPICNKKVSRTSLIILYHDWNVSPNEGNAEEWANKKIQQLLSEKTQLTNQLSMANKEIQNAHKDIKNLRRNLKCQLKEKSRRNEHLQRELDSLKRLNTDSIYDPNPKKRRLNSPIDISDFHSQKISLSMPTNSCLRYDASIASSSKHVQDAGFDLPATNFNDSPVFSNSFERFISTLNQITPNFMDLSHNSTGQSNPSRPCSSNETTRLPCNRMRTPDTFNPMVSIDLSDYDSPLLPPQAQVVDLTDTHSLDLTGD